GQRLQTQGGRRFRQSSEHDAIDVFVRRLARRLDRAVFQDVQRGALLRPCILHRQHLPIDRGSLELLLPTSEPAGQSVLLTFVHRISVAAVLLVELPLLLFVPLLLSRQRSRNVPLVGTVKERIEAVVLPL